MQVALCEFEASLLYRARQPGLPRENLSGKNKQTNMPATPWLMFPAGDDSKSLDRSTVTFTGCPFRLRTHRTRLEIKKASSFALTFPAPLDGAVTNHMGFSQQPGPTYVHLLLSYLVARGYNLRLTAKTIPKTKLTFQAGVPRQRLGALAAFPKPSV